MIWLTWRQLRAQFLTVLAALAALIVVLAYTGPHLVHLYHLSGIQACRATQGDCGPLIDDFTSHFPLLRSLGALVIVVPALVGVFFGGPLVARELETGTHRVAWTQSVTRTRWLITKMAVVAAASTGVVATVTVAVALWSSPLDTVNGGRLAPGAFDQRGIVAAAYTLFAFVVGVAAGALIRRTLPAMAATLALFGATRFAVEHWVRPHYAPAHHLVANLFGDTAAIGPGDWTVSSRVVDAAGHTIAFRRDTLRSLCQLPERGGGFNRGALQACAQRLGIQRISTVQPANRFWSFQLFETGLFVGLAVILTGLTFWVVRHRLR